MGSSGIVSPELTILFQPLWKYERKKNKQKETKAKNIPHGRFISNIHETSRRTTSLHPQNQEIPNARAGRVIFFTCSFLSTFQRNHCVINFPFSKEQHRSVDQSWTMLVEHALFHLSRT